MQNVLLVTDDPLSSVSIYGDRHLERFQAVHGRLPPALVEFIQGPARWDVRLCAWLLHLAKQCDAGQLRATGLWALYLESLPPAADLNLLLSFTPMEQMHLQLPRYMKEAELQRDAAQLYHYEYFYGRNAELAALELSASLERTMWAQAMVRSRTFGTAVAGEAVTLMAPYLDLANHSPDYNASFRVATDRENFELFGYDDLGPGQELFITYGDTKSNFELMRDYGFIVPNNRADRAYLAHDLRLFVEARGATPDAEALATEALRSASDYQFATELQDQLSKAEQAQAASPHRLSCYLLFRAFGVAGAAHDSPFEVDPEEGPLMQAALRSLGPFIEGSLDDDGGIIANRPRGLFAALWTVPDYSDAAVPVAYSTTALDDEHALAASLHSLISALSQSYQTSLEADVDELRTKGPQSPRRMPAVAARAEYKRVVRACLGLLERYMEYLESLPRAS